MRWWWKPPALPRPAGSVFFLGGKGEKGGKFRELDGHGVPKDLTPLWPEYLMLEGIPFSSCSPKALRQAVIPARIARATIDWNQSAGLAFDWRSIWGKVWKPRVPSPWNYTYYILLHRALTTGAKAKSRGFPPIPEHCSCGEVESLEHLFLHCHLATAAWNEARLPPTSTTLVSPTRRQQRSHRAVIHTLWTARCAELDGNKPRSAVSIVETLRANLKRLTSA